MRWLLVGLLVCCGGCGSLQYQGWSPSFRWMTDDPGVRDVYVGADANFAIEDQPSVRAVALAEHRPVDGWNTPVACQPLTQPVSADVREAGVSAEPLLDGK